MAGKKGHRSWGHVRRLPSRRQPGRGRWQASYVGPDMRRHKAPRTFADRLSAERWLADERRLIDNAEHEWTAPVDRERERWAVGETLAEYAQRWIDERHALKPRTRKLYEGQLRLLIVPALGDVPVRRLTYPQIRRWFGALDRDKTRRNAQAYGLLHSILNTAVKDGLLQSNPCQIEGVMNAGSRKRDPIILSPKQLRLLSEAVPERYRALVLLSAWCGLRWGEATELRRSDVSDNAEVLTVARAVTHRDGCRIDTPKSGKGRTVVIPPHIREAVKHHLNVHTGEGDSALLFPAVRQRDGHCGHLNDRVFDEAAWRPGLKSIGVQGVRRHDLRHFAGTMTAQVGSLAETMQRLGHSTVKASLIYQGIVNGRDDAIAAALSRLAEGE